MYKMKKIIITLICAVMAAIPAMSQNINKNEMFIDFLGDKGGARLTYGKKFEFYDGERSVYGVLSASN